MEQPQRSDNCQTSPVSAGGGARPQADTAHAPPMKSDGRWRCREDYFEAGERHAENCHREQARQEGECHRAPERLEEDCHRAQERQEEQQYHRAPERLEGDYHRDDWQEENCPREQVDCRARESSPGAPPGGAWQGDDAAPPTGDGWNGRAAAAPPGGAEEEWRKKKHRRRPSKKKRRWKPYFKLSWEEKRQLEEREAARAARLRAEMFAKGQPVAPYNTTQFLMEDRAQDEPDLQAGGAESSEEEEQPPAEPRPGLRPFLLRDFSETYERYHTESLQSMSKQQLLREYLELEKCLSRMEDENNRLRGDPGGEAPQQPHRLSGLLPRGSLPQYPSTGADQPKATPLLPSQNTGGDPHTGTYQPKGTPPQHPQNARGDPLQQPNNSGIPHQGGDALQKPHNTAITHPGGNHFPNIADDPSQHPHNVQGGTMQDPQNLEGSHSATGPLQPPHNVSDPHPATLHQHKVEHPCIVRGCDPRGEPQYHPRSEGELQQHPHPRILELELELDKLRAQNTRLLQEKKVSGPPNNCGE